MAKKSDLYERIGLVLAGQVETSPVRSEIYDRIGRVLRAESRRFKMRFLLPARTVILLDRIGLALGGVGVSDRLGRQGARGEEIRG